MVAGKECVMDPQKTIARIKAGWRKLTKDAKRKALARMRGEVGYAVLGPIAALPPNQDADLAVANALDKALEQAKDATGQAALDLANELDRMYQAVAEQVKRLEKEAREKAVVWGAIAVGVLLAFGYAARGARG